MYPLALNWIRNKNMEKLLNTNTCLLNANHDVNYWIQIYFYGIQMWIIEHKCIFTDYKCQLVNTNINYCNNSVTIVLGNNILSDQINEISFELRMETINIKNMLSAFKLLNFWKGCSPASCDYKMGSKKQRDRHLKYNWSLRYVTYFAIIPCWLHCWK